jgi:hypothetical protein
VDPAEAMRHVERTLPQLDETGVAALALVQLAGCSREEAAERAGLPLDETGAALARARKELRRSRMALPGTGWCERAELMISDRLDGQLEPPGPDRLAVHLRNCPRCVDHERRLAQAIDALVADFVGEAERLTEAAGYLPAPELAQAGSEPPTPELAVVDAPERGPAPVAARWRAVALPPLKEREQAVPLEAPAPPAEEVDIAAALAEDIVAAPPADWPQPDEREPEPEQAVEPARATVPRPLTGGLGVAWTVLFALAEDIVAAPPADWPQPDEREPEPEQAVEPARATVPRPLTGGLGVAWTVLFALAVALAVGTVAIAVVGLLGGSI